jgi:1,4-dihydroxy-2-naphthoate octaprenyltransferase
MHILVNLLFLKEKDLEYQFLYNMGPLMVLGASYPFTQSISLYPILLSLPASFIIPALMIIMR